MVKGYKEQDGCHNCEHAFKKFEYDDATEYYCHIDRSERPQCCSLKMEESPSIDRGLPMNERYQAYRDWDSWAGPRKVQSWGKCPRHKRSLKDEV